MDSTLEAPVVEPHPSATEAGHGQAVEVRAVDFRHGELRVLDGLELQAAAGEVVGLVGPSGCGKTTFLELVAGLLEPAAGSIRIGAEEGSRLAHCAYMPQRDLLLPWLSAVDNATIAPRNRGVPAASARAEAAPLLRSFGLEGFEDSCPHELSGGMRQRVAFARTVLAGKPVMLLDEPFGGLDAITRAEMQEWLAVALGERDQTILLVTHDVEEALYLCDRVRVLSPRPARVVAELAAANPRGRPRTEVVATLEFVQTRERALAALGAAR